MGIPNRPRSSVKEIYTFHRMEGMVKGLERGPCCRQGNQPKCLKYSKIFMLQYVHFLHIVGTFALRDLYLYVYVL